MTLFDFLQWCLSDFWRWLGLFFLVVGFGASIGGVVRIKNVPTHRTKTVTHHPPGKT